MKIDAKTINQEILSRIIPHPIFDEAFSKAKELFELKDLGMPGSGMVLHGPSGAGKSTLIEAVYKYGIANYGEDSVIRTKLGHSSNVKAMLSSMIFEFGDPLSKTSTAKDIERRLTTAIKERDCRLLIVDELQHLIPGGTATPRTIDNILDTFKILDETGVSFLLVGMDSVMHLWGSDTQLRSRFRTNIYLGHFSQTKKDQKNWRLVVRKFDKTLQKHGTKIDCPDYEDRFYAATLGSMRQLVLILTTAVAEAAREDSDVITQKHLQIASSKQIDKQDGIHNAFDLDLNRVRQFSRDFQTNTELAPVERGMGEIFRK